MPKRWTKAEEALLGKYDDKTIALMTGRTKTAVAVHRVKINQGNSYYTGLICPMCGREFFPPVKEEWAYQRKRHGRTMYLCTYKCARRVDRGDKPRKEKGA